MSAERNEPLVLFDDRAQPVALRFGLSRTRRRSDVLVRKRAIAVGDGRGGAEIGFGLAQLRQGFDQLAAGNSHQLAARLNSFAGHHLDRHDSAREWRRHGDPAVQRRDDGTGQKRNRFLRCRAHFLELDLETIDLRLRNGDFRGQRCVVPQSPTEGGQYRHDEFCLKP